MRLKRMSLPALCVLLLSVPVSADSGFRERSREIGQGFRKLGQATGSVFIESGRCIGDVFRRITRVTGQAFRDAGRKSGEVFRKR